MPYMQYMLARRDSLTNSISCISYIYTKTAFYRVGSIGLYCWYLCVLHVLTCSACMVWSGVHICVFACIVCIVSIDRYGWYRYVLLVFVCIACIDM